MGYRPDIDGLRAIAVLAVVLFHAGFSALGGGFVGVDVFFVISGFLITKLIVDDPRFSLLAFYQRRARRILPALAVVVLATSVAAYIFFLPEEFLAFSKGVVATTLFSSNILFWQETGYFDAPRDLKPLLHTWSLAVEEQFYFVYPLLLMFCRRVLRSRWIVLLLPLCLISLWASALPSPHATRRRRSTSRRSGRGSSYWALSWRWARSPGLGTASRVSCSPRSASPSSCGASSPIRKLCPSPA
jgi:peptidoglycan/LPS O-acetylase OafA/YrhL